MPEIRWSSRVPYGGGGSQGVLLHRGRGPVGRGGRGRRLPGDQGPLRFAVRRRPDRGPADVGAFRLDRDAVVLAVRRAHAGVVDVVQRRRYMHQYGATNEDFGRAVVQMRAYAATNPNAHFYERPITLDDHQASRWIAEPAIRLFDCCQETDGAVALVVTSADRARDTPAPVVIAAAAAAGLFEEEIASNHYRPDLAVMDGSVALARRLFDETGISRDDIDVAMIYDAFSPILLMQLEALGFCGPGEAKDFIADGNLGPTGRCPATPTAGSSARATSTA